MQEEDKFKLALDLITKTSIEFTEEFTGLTREEIYANLTPEEQKKFDEIKKEEMEGEQLQAAWEKWHDYQLSLKPKRDYMNILMYERDQGYVKGFVKGFVEEYTKMFPQEEDQAKLMAAKELKSEGYSIELIEEATGLTSEEFDDQK